MCSKKSARHPRVAAIMSLRGEKLKGTLVCDDTEQLNVGPVTCAGACLPQMYALAAPRFGSPVFVVQINPDGIISLNKRKLIKEDLVVSFASKHCNKNLIDIL